MSADELHKAAEVLRERATAATEGPWRVCAEGSEGSRIAPDSGDKRERTRFIGIMNGRVQPEDGRNARYAATMHPGVGLALADWLDQCAKGACCDGCMADPAADPLREQALRIARLINGSAS
jgi:hypothetical protein